MTIHLVLAVASPILAVGGLVLVLRLLVRVISALSSPMPRLHLLLAKPWRIPGTILSVQSDNPSQEVMDCVLAATSTGAGGPEQLVALTCPNCGAPLPPAVATQAVVCSYCNTAVVREIPQRGIMRDQMFQVMFVLAKVQPEVDGDQTPPVELSVYVASSMVDQFKQGQVVTLYGEWRTHGKGRQLFCDMEMLGFVDERTARASEATVVSCTPSAKSNPGKRWLEMTVALDSSASSRATITGFFPESLVEWFAPGSRLPVLVDANDQGCVAVDWSRAIGAVVGAEGNVVVRQGEGLYPARVEVFARSDADKLFCVVGANPGEWISLEYLSLPGGAPLQGHDNTPAVAG